MGKKYRKISLYGGILLTLLTFLISYITLSPTNTVFSISLTVISGTISFFGILIVFMLSKGEI